MKTIIKTAVLVSLVCFSFASVYAQSTKEKEMKQKAKRII